MVLRVGPYDGPLPTPLAPCEQRQLEHLALVRALRIKDRAYIESVLAQLEPDAQERGRQNLNATGYIAGAESVGAHCDDAYNW